jgi:hypothetical protein
MPKYFADVRIIFDIEDYLSPGEHIDIKIKLVGVVDE